jgi:hypothetical protein
MTYSTATLGDLSRHDTPEGVFHQSADQALEAPVRRKISEILAEHPAHVALKVTERYYKGDLYRFEVLWLDAYGREQVSFVSP